MNSVSETTSLMYQRLVSPNEDIDTLFEKAQKVPDLVEKRVVYNEIYQIIRQQTSFDPKKLFQLFEEYATKTCYAQANLQTNDDEEGFRKSARLMELNFHLQLVSMNLDTFCYDWQKYEGLEDLIKDLEIKNDQKSLFFDKMCQLIIDGDVILQQAADLRDIVGKTLVRLTYSYQNMESISESPYLSLHQKLNELTEKVIGNESTSQKATLIDYRYNRCLFLAQLTNPDDFDSHFNSYNKVETLAIDSYEKDSPKLLSLLAQIANMKGILILKKIPTLLDGTEQIYSERALRFFLDALKLRETLITLDPHNATENEYFLSNLRTGIIHCLVNQNPLNKESVNEAILHAEALKSYLLKNPRHSYHESWERAIAKAENASKLIALQ